MKPYEDWWPIDWKLKLCQVLQSFGDMDGVWYEDGWEEYGVSREELVEIEGAFAMHEMSALSKELERKRRETNERIGLWKCSKCGTTGNRWRRCDGCHLMRSVSIEREEAIAGEMKKCTA